MHGSGLTNLVFTLEGCEVLEIDLTHQWTCDPLFDAHLSGLLAPGEACSAQPPRYHKADYHSLCGLYGRPYQSLSAVRGSGYRGINPIDLSVLEVSGASLLEMIKASFGRSDGVVPPATHAPITVF